MTSREKKPLSAEGVASILLRKKAVTLRINPPYTWTSGIKAPIYTDNRLLMSYLPERSAIVEALINLIESNKIQCEGIAATATAGIPWGAWIAGKLGLPMVFVRGKAKGHGKENSVEGIVEKGKHYIVVEDLISTGGSSVNTSMEVRAKGGIVSDIVAIFTYQLPASAANFRNEKLIASTLTNFTALIKTAVKEKYIRDKDEAIVMKWKESPEGWGP